MALRICVDGLFLIDHYPLMGIKRYMINLLRQLEQISAHQNHLDFQILVPPHAEIDSSHFVRRDGFELVPYLPMQWRKAWRLGLTLPATKLLKADALFLPSPLPVFLKHRRIAVTVHDIVPLLFSDQYSSCLERTFIRYSFVSSLKAADLVFTDSYSSKRDILSRFRIPEDRVVVAYCGYDSVLFSPGSKDSPECKEVQRRYGIKQPYVLHAGHMQPRKNILRLVQAYRLLMQRRGDLTIQLALIGELTWGCQQLLRMLREPDLRNNVVLTGVVPDRDLAILYRGAACFAMPSLYEGFGLPLLEAMGSGVPVMSSNRSSLPEVGGNGAFYFDPESVEEISTAMEKLLCDSALREQLVARGLAQAKQFTWEGCARTTLKALEALCKA